MTSVSTFEGQSRSGLTALVFIGAAVALSLVMAVAGGLITDSSGAAGFTLVAAGLVLFIGAICVATGLYMLQPNKAAVFTLFGDYKGTDTQPGLRFANPLYRKRRISLRIRNFTTQRSKVNDANGNPIEIAAVVVWKVSDTAPGSVWCQ